MKGTIIYIGGELPDKDASALRILANCKALREDGYNVVIISPSSDKERVLRQTETVCGFPVYYYHLPRTTNEWFRELMSIREYQDVITSLQNVIGVICYNHHGISLIRLTRWLHRKGIKVYSDCTEWHTVSHLPIIKRIVKWLDIIIRIKYAQKKTDGVISISRYFAEMYRPFTKVTIVPPLIDIHDPIWKKDLEVNAIRTFSYTGRMGISKDLLSMCINVFYELCEDYDFRFKILGCTKDEYLERNPEDDSKLNKLGEKISFKGYASHSAAVALTKSSDFSVLIREHNRKNDSGFPTKLTESVACGTPVIATDFSDVKKYILENKIGIMIEGDCLKQALTRAIQMPEKEIIKYKESCRNCQVFDYRNYIEIFEAFLSNK